MIGNSAFSPFPNVAGMRPNPIQQRAMLQTQATASSFPRRGWPQQTLRPMPIPMPRPMTQTWRGRPPSVVNNYYSTPAPITPEAAPVAMTTPSPTMVVPPSMPEPQPNISPASPTADLGPTQDAHEAVAEAAVPAEHPGHAWGRKIIIGLVVAGVAFGGYKLYKSRKKPAHGGHGHGHGMQGARRRRRR